MVLHPHLLKFINPWSIKKAKLGETSLDVVHKSYEGSIEIAVSLAVQEKNTEICPD